MKLNKKCLTCRKKNTCMEASRMIACIFYEEKQTSNEAYSEQKDGDK